MSTAKQVLLAIDTSAGSSVAVIDGQTGVVVERNVDDGMRHAEVIGVLISEVLDGAGFVAADITAVAAGMGPGPFTGLRVGIAAAQTFVLARDCVFAPVVSHDAIAWKQLHSSEEVGSGETGLEVVTDARRQELAVSNYKGFDENGFPRRITGPVLLRRVDYSGNAEITPRISAGDVGLLALRALSLGISIGPAAPLYLRQPDVTMSAATRGER